MSEKTSLPKEVQDELEQAADEAKEEREKRERQERRENTKYGGLIEDE